MSATTWDVVVVGAGPAGLSAARAVAAARLRCLCIDRLGPGGELVNIGILHDSLELSPETTGADVLSRLTDAAAEAGVELAFGEVRELRRGDNWLVATEDETYAAKTVILATGLAPGTLGVPGEADFEGLGLSHCAACDGPLYRGQDVIVAGAGEWAQQEAIDLAGLAGHVTLVWPEDAAPPSGKRAAKLAGLSNVTLRTGRIVGLEGGEGLEAAIVEHGPRQQRQPARAVFVQANRRAALGFARDLLAVDADGRACTDGDLRTGEPWIYAAGDVRSGTSELVSAAIADGQRAATAVARLLGGTGQREDGE